MIFSSHLILSNVSHLEPTNCFNNSLLGKKRNFVPRTLWILIWFISSSVSSVQSLSYVLLFVTPWTVAGQASLSITNSQSLLKLMFTELVMPSNNLILCRPLLLPPSIFPSIFSNGSFQMSQFFASGGQSIGVSASASVLPKNIQDWFPLRWTGWISLLSKGLSRVFSNTAVQKHHSLVLSFL